MEQKEFENIEISKEDYERIVSQGKKEDLDRLLEYELIKFKEERKREGVIKVKNEYLKVINKGIPQEEEKIKKVISEYMGKRELAKKIMEVQPYFYDRAKLWWLWNTKKFRWEVVDDKDILNIVHECSDANTVATKEKAEILEAMQQFGRKQIPKPIKKTWIQFKNKIYDIENGEIFDAKPEYLVTNPLPFRMHPEKFMETPTMDRIFEEWVGKDKVRQLYEILAYCMLPDYPIHRLFCFMGAGLNGKTKFLELLRKFIGDGNCCTTELDTLMKSRFEITRLHKKLVCQMGETDFSEMSKTSTLKKLTGGDLIGYEYKNKNPFEENNYAKILIATNNLPTTTDKTLGFYRRWMIIDFPNTFSEKKDILKDIPDEEYEYLTLKCAFILKDLLDERSFTNEGTIEERKEKFEARSNFLEKFLTTFTSEDGIGYITKADFNKRFSSWCKENRHREMSETSVGLQMKKLGVESGKRYFDWLHDGKGGQARVFEGIKWKEEEKGD
jgi:P4 family phage/plasmid primase-like protien